MNLKKTEDPASQLRRQASHHRDHARLLGLALVEVDRSGLDSIEDMTRAEWMECNKVFKKSLQTSLGQTRYAHLKATYEQFRKVVADVYQGDDSLVEPVKLGIKVASLATYARNEWIQQICVNEKAKFIVKLAMARIMVPKVSGLALQQYSQEPFK